MKGEQKSKFKSYKDLFRKLHPQLSAVAYHHVKDSEEAKEIVQEIFLDAWKDYTEFDNENDITVFFYDAIVNKCNENTKDKKTKVIVLNEFTKPTVDEFEDIIIDPTKVIENIIDNLPKDEANAIRQRIKKVINKRSGQF